MSCCMLRYSTATSINDEDTDEDDADNVDDDEDDAGNLFSLF